MGMLEGLLATGFREALDEVGVRGDVWLDEEGEDQDCGVQDDYARVGWVEATGVLAADDLVHAWVLPPAGCRDGGRGIVDARGRGEAFLWCDGIGHWVVRNGVLDFGGRRLRLRLLVVGGGAGEVVRRLHQRGGRHGWRLRVCLCLICCPDVDVRLLLG